MPIITWTHPDLTVRQDRPGSSACEPLNSRFTFQRTAGTPLALVDVGTYYTLASNQTVVATAGTFGLGIGGFLKVEPPRNFGFSWKPLARSTPAPLVLGTTSPYTLKIEMLYYPARNMHEAEDFIRGVPTILKGYQGTLRHYQAGGVAVYKTYTNCYFTGMSHSYEGSKNFVEYGLTFETISEPT